MKFIKLVVLLIIIIACTDTRRIKTKRDIVDSIQTNKEDNLSYSQKDGAIQTKLDFEEYLYYTGIGRSKDGSPQPFNEIKVKITNDFNQTIASNYIPRNVTLLINYYQTELEKKISNVELIFSNFTKIETNGSLPLSVRDKYYNFNFQLVPWTWMECMIYFMFPMTWYLLVLIIVIMIVILVFSVINMVARRTTLDGLVPKFNPMIALRQGYESLVGVALSLIPFIPLMMIIKLGYNNLDLGLMLYDKLLDTQINYGRIGAAFFITGLLGLILALKLMIPKVDYFDTHCNINLI